MTPLVQRFGVLAVLAVSLWPSAARAKAKSKTQLALDVKPPSALVFIDDKPMGKAGTGRVLDITPGFHIVRLKNKGDENEDRLKILPNQKTVYTFEFDESGAPPAAGEGTTEGSPVPEDVPQKNEAIKP